MIRSASMTVYLSRNKIERRCDLQLDRFTEIAIFPGASRYRGNLNKFEWYTAAPGKKIHRGPNLGLKKRRKKYERIE